MKHTPNRSQFHSLIYDQLQHPNVPITFFVINLISTSPVHFWEKKVQSIRAQSTNSACVLVSTNSAAHVCTGPTEYRSVAKSTMKPTNQTQSSAPYPGPGSTDPYPPNVAGRLRRLLRRGRRRRASRRRTGPSSPPLLRHRAPAEAYVALPVSARRASASCPQPVSPVLPL